jgi:hypothetical protein
MTTTLHMVFQGLPPTSNHIYFQGNRLTEEARRYAEQFSLEAVRYQHLFHQLIEEALYALHLRFFMNLVNETWNNTNLPPSRRAKSRYKKVDLDNRIKLITDCVRDAVDIDDSHIFAASQEKHHVSQESQQHVEIYLQQVDPALFGL